VHAALFTVAALFSLNYIISKVGMRSFAPLSFAYLRVLGAAIVLNVGQAILPVRPEGRQDCLPYTQITLYAILGVVANQALFLAGLALTSAHIAAILITTIPVFTLAIAIALRREQATWLKGAGIALAAAGALLVVWGEGVSGTRASFLGALMIIGNSLSFSLYLVLSKPLMAYVPARLVIARMFAAAAVLMVPLCGWSLVHERWPLLPAGAWLSLAGVIAGPTVAAYVLNGWALARAEATLVATYMYVQPLLTAVLAAIYLGETIRGVAVAAAVMIFAGVWLAGHRAAA
jgi:drug/metabolite transporter (DMT)-like permease